MTYSKNWKAQSSRKVWRERATTYQQHAVVQDSTDASYKSPCGGKNVSSVKDAKNVRQWEERSFKSILLSGSDGAASGQRGQVPCGEDSKSNDLPLALTDANLVDRTQRSSSSAEDVSHRARWSDISESADAMSEPEWAGLSSNSMDGDAVSVTESTFTGGMDSSSTGTVGSQKEGGSDSMPTDSETSPLLLPSSSLEDSPEGLPFGELPASPWAASPYLEIQPCGIQTGVCTPDELEPPEFWPNEQGWESEIAIGEGWCNWMPAPVWNPAVATASDEVLPQDQPQEDVSQIEVNQPGCGSNNMQWVVTGYMPVVKMVEACPQQDVHTEENLPQQTSECYLPLDGSVPLTEDAMTESLIGWKLDQAWSEDEHQQPACSSALPWPATAGEGDLFFGDYVPCDYYEGMWYQDMPNLVDDASVTAHCVQTARAVANAQAMRANTWTTQRLEDGTATAASSTDALTGSALNTSDNFLRGLRAPVHGNVPRTRDFAAESAAESRPEAQEEITTLMIRNIPNRYKRSTLMRELDHLGLTGKYDFLYIPVDRGTSWNVGYAFVNFFTPEFAKECMDQLQDHTFLQCKNGVDKVAQVSAAHMQGWERNVAYYRSCAVHSARECQRPFIIEEKVDLEQAKAMVRPFL